MQLYSVLSAISEQVILWFPARHFQTSNIQALIKYYLKRKLKVHKTVLEVKKFIGYSKTSYFRINVALAHPNVRGVNITPGKMILRRNKTLLIYVFSLIILIALRY